MSDSSPSQLAIDTGGTFTDYVARYPDNEIKTGKVPSTPEHPSKSIGRVFEKLNVTERTRFVHGTTVATNALLEDQLADVLLIVNEGLEGLAAIGRGTRRDLHDLNPDPDSYPFQDLDTVGVDLRDHPFTESTHFLSDPEASRLRNIVRERDPEVVAVCLVHSYNDASGEEAVASALDSLDVPVVRSSEVLPRFREFERASTTVINAGLRPIITRYLENIKSLSGAPDKASVMASDHGTMRLEEAVRKPVRTVLSGPTAGLVGARAVAPDTDSNGLITMDIGGTSTDVSLLEDGEIPLTEGREIGHYPIAQPLADIHTIGSGGGSVVWVDDGGHLRVGPQSAGADPGPACYGEGGPATVTDALVILGRIPTDRPISGDLNLSEGSARSAFGQVGEQLGREPIEVATGTMRIVYSQLAEAIRTVTVERGHRPKDYDLVAFGGGGGLYGAKLAETLGIERVIQPRQAGVGSARGLLHAPRCYQVTTSPLAELSDSAEKPPGLDRLLNEVPDTVAHDHLRLEAECQFKGQTHTINVTVDRSADCASVRRQFIDRYEETYGYRPDETRVELVHLNGYWLNETDFDSGRDPRNGRSESAEPIGEQSVYVDGTWESIPADRLETVRTARTGPYLLLGDTTTVYVPPGWSMKPEPEVVTLHHAG
jgi:N-methylhydantoinase A